MSKFIFWRKRFETSFDRLLLSIFARFSLSMASLLGRPLTLFGLFGLVGLPPVGESSSIILLSKSTTQDQRPHFSGPEPPTMRQLPSSQITGLSKSLKSAKATGIWTLNSGSNVPVRIRPNVNKQPTRVSHPGNIGDDSSVIGPFIGRTEGTWTSQSGEKDA